MAWSAATAAYTEKKPLRSALQRNTIGQVFSKSFQFSCGASSNTDTIELTSCKVPANTALLAFYTKAANSANGVAANGPANSGLAFKFTTANVEFANAANNVTANWTSHLLATAAANQGKPMTGANDDTITVTQVGSANAVGALTITATMVLVGLGGHDAPYTTYTT